MIFKADLNNKMDISNSKYIEAGIQENLELDRIESGTSKNGNKFIAFYWKDSSGAEVSKTEWEPKKNEGETDQKLQEKGDKLMKRMRHMLVDSSILTEAEWGFESPSFEALGQELINRVIKTNKHKGVKVRAKVVYDNNNYTTLPNYTTATWIEPMSVENTLMRKLPKLDRFERVAATELPKIENPFGTDMSDVDVEPQHSDDIPF